MGWLHRKKTYDRTRLLNAATRARKKGKRQKAIELYRQVLQVEPDNPDLHRRVAALLAETNQGEEAWASYRRAAEGLERRGFSEQAVGVLREAATYLPREPAIWGALADHEMQRKRPVDAHKVLLEGRKHFRSRKDRSHAILLLLRARKLAPHDFATNFDLSGLLARAGALGRARSLLEEIATWARGHELRRVRARQLVLSPTPAALWRWLGAVFSGR
jgi:tetratricopeptide (TPR) repeat protein